MTFIGKIALLIFNVMMMVTLIGAFHEMDFPQYWGAILIASLIVFLFDEKKND